MNRRELLQGAAGAALVPLLPTLPAKPIGESIVIQAADIVLVGTVTLHDITGRDPPRTFEFSFL